MTLKSNYPQINGIPIRPSAMHSSSLMWPHCSPPEKRSNVQGPPENANPQN